jgi:ATP-dependent exoDNAse (exonuclease V) beta subunit
MLFPVLNNFYKHERDNNIEFEEFGHKYKILTDVESTYTSVTTFIHSHFPNFEADKIIEKMMKGKSWKEGHKYWNMTQEEIKNQWKENGNNVSQLGTQMHFEFECFMNNPNLPIGYTHNELLDNYIKNNSNNNEISDFQILKEWIYFIEFIKDFPHLKPYRTEWTIYDEELKLAGSIDMVYENSDKTLSIYDWKRVKNITTVNNFNKYAITDSICHMPDSNFWHYTLQLNIYKTILEKKYNKSVSDLYLVRIHPESEENTYELIKIPILLLEINDLFDERKKILIKNA